MRKDMRILLVGDEGVGKTSLITALLKEEFVDKVEHVLGEVTIPPHVTPEKITTHIVDSSSRAEFKDKLEREIRKATVICVVYSVAAPETFHRVTTHWLPYIRKLGVNVPIILVGNKIDLRGPNKNLEDEIMPIMNDWKEVETCVECSAKEILNISEVFYFAQKAVLHPTGPLYDANEQDLKPKCKEALKRIFKLCDLDKDGVLNDDELNEFQRVCFNAPLQLQELEGIKRVVRENCVDGINENGINEAGFLFLHMMFIQRGRLETTWTVLRRFGYGDDLELQEEFLYPKISPFPDQSVELSRAGTQFFVELFETFDQDHDGALSPEELDRLFQTAPGTAWPNMKLEDTTVVSAANWVTLKGFLALWSMTTLLDYKTTLAYLAYLGFNGSTKSAITLSRRRREERKSAKVTRNVLLCYVIGAVGSGKTAALRRHIRKPFLPNYEHTEKPYTVVNTVEINGAEKYLVLQELSTGADKELLSDRKLSQAADCICFLYDSSDPNSFTYIAKLLEENDLDQTPCLVVATKSDKDHVPQRYEIQPDEFCRRLNLSVPVSVSFKDSVTADIYSLIVGVALDPQTAIPTRETKPVKRGIGRTILYGSLGTIFLGGALYLTWRWWRVETHSGSSIHSLIESLLARLGFAQKTITAE